MAGNVTPKDMQNVSDAVLAGKMEMSNLPDYVQAAVADYWEQSGVNLTGPEDVSAAQMKALMESRQAQEGSFLDSPVFKPIEWVGSKLYWLYSNTVSPALSSGFNAARSAIYSRPDYIGEDGEWDALKDYWSLSKNVSPGQAIWMLGMNDKELAERGIRPDQIAEDMRLVNQGKYKDKATVNDPYGTLTRAQEYFGSGASKYVTGSADLALSWYADPLVLLGKGASAAKAAGVTRNVSTQIEKSVKELQAQGMTLEQAQMQAWDHFSTKRPFQGMVDTIMDIKTSNPDTAAAVLTRDFATLRKSANGPAVARLLAQAKDSDEVVDIMRVTMGDHVGALSLEAKSILLADQVSALTSTNARVSQYYDSMPDAVKNSPWGQRVKAQIDQETATVSKMNAENRIIDDKLAAYNLIGDMNFNRLTTSIGMKVRGAEIQPVKGQGLIKGSTNLIYNTAIGVPIKLAHTYHGIKPSHYIDTKAENGWQDVQAALGEVRGLSKEGRDMYVSRYINAKSEDKALELVKMEQAITHRIIDRYNLKNPSDQIDYTLADDLYKEFAERRHAAQQGSVNRRSYGNATMPDPNNPGMTVRVAEIMSDGSRLVPTPILESQLASSHVLMDFGLFEKVVQANGSAWKKRKLHAGDAWIKADDVASTLGSVWKFTQLFRLGYGPRALADDVLGQVARFGMFDMVARTIKGGRVSLEDWHNQRWLMDRTENARMTGAMLDTHIDDLLNRQKAAKVELGRAKAGLSSGNVGVLEFRMSDLVDQVAEARKVRADMDSLVAGGQQMRRVQVGRETFAPAFGGTEGGLFRDLASGQRNFANMMGSQADWALKRMRTNQWEDISPATKGEAAHFEAWRRVLGQQFANDRLARQVMAGKSEAELARWINATPEGQLYRSSSPLKNVSVSEMVQRVKAEVDYVADTALPGMDTVRQAVLRGDTITDDMLKNVPSSARPLVNAERFEYARGTHPVAEMMDRAMTGYFELANQMPARKLLRNPLFGQQYKANLSDALRKLRAQGVTHIDESTRTRLESSARQNALRDVKRYTFTMDHETKMAYMMRHFGAFFGAQQESWNRWARIISDKPQVLPHVAQVYGAPSRAGLVVDQDGNAVDATGHTTDETGERKLVDYADRKMLVQIPDYLGGKKLNKFLGLDEDATFTVPMSSVELILNHGDGPLPVGAGPYVQIAANNLPMTELDASGTPELADFYTKMGILPMGPKESVWDFVNSNTGQRLGDAGNDFSETKQRSMFYMMQVENYKWEQGLRKTEPTWGELEKRASKWAWFRTGMAFGLPFSVNAQDPYQFFRDEYQRYQKLDPNSSDQKFYDKYGDSFFAFSQSMSKNNSGLRPTAESVKMSKRYQDLIAQVGPEYAGLIAGVEGEGEYSDGAYFYQKTHTTDPASLTPQRQQLGSREAWEQSQVARGWAFYNSQMEDVNARFFDQGFTSYDDPGAEELKNERKAILDVLTQAYLPDGRENPYYNQAWREKFSTMDKSKYDRTALDLEKVVTDPELWAKAFDQENGNVGIRSDIYTLKTYLERRKYMQANLIMREQNGGSKDITAQSNYDLKNSWDTEVMALIEADTRFAWVHSRFFATDMGFNIDTQVSAEAQEALATSDATLVGSEATNGQDMPTMFDVMQNAGDEFYGG